jgi:hypothetical protein
MKGPVATPHSYVEIPANAAFNFTTGFTVEAWVSGSDAGGCTSIAGKGYTQAWWVGVCGTTLRSYIKGITSLKDGGTVSNGWTHIAVTYDGANRKHYIDGALVYTNAETGPMGVSTSAVRINSDVSWQFSYGASDEVRLWNVARTQAEILATISSTLDAAQPGLVAVYHLDRSANDALGGNNGTSVGVFSSPPFGAWLVKGPASAPHSYIEIPANSAFNFATGFTIEGWVFGTDTGSCTSIAGKGYTQAWWVGVCGTTLRSYIKGITSLRDGGTVAANTWTHVAITYDGTNRKHYVNGALVLTNAETGPMGSSTAPVRINSDASWEFSFGSIDEVRLWNVARTQAEIQTAMNSAINAPRSGLVAVYHLDGSAIDALALNNGTTRGQYSTPVVAEFYNTNLDHYFITADLFEAADIDRGSAGPGWSRTGNAFISAGATAVCRFYGSQSPGPNSHFYTADAGECAFLRALQASTPATEKRWNFESFDFLTTAPVSRNNCPVNTKAIYRAYNNGFARGIDSNHRITGNLAAIQAVVARGWINEGVVMCAPV